MAESPSSIPFVSRFFLAWACFFKVMFDGVFAARVAGLSAPELPAPAKERDKPTLTSALQLLALLQREGRLIDFLQQDIVSFSDADVGAAARVVHEGCRKALKGHVELESLRGEEEGARVVLEDGFDAGTIKLLGNVHGSAPFKGTLRHKGWRAKKITLPETTKGHDPSVLAPAEVEL